MLQSVFVVSTSPLCAVFVFGVRLSNLCRGVDLGLHTAEYKEGGSLVLHAFDPAFYTNLKTNGAMERQQLHKYLESEAAAGS